MALTPEKTRRRAKIARLCQSYPPDHPELVQLRTEAKAERASEYIEKVLAEAPPLTAEQRTKLAELLRPVRPGGDLHSAVSARLVELDGGAAG